jgi:hypothetical protein
MNYPQASPDGLMNPRDEINHVLLIYSGEKTRKYLWILQASYSILLTPEDNRFKSQFDDASIIILKAF